MCLVVACEYRNTTDSAELVTNYESSLSLPDILPLRIKQYDKNRAPKLLGQPTVVYFHVTVLSLDSINEVSDGRSGSVGGDGGCYVNNNSGCSNPNDRQKFN